MPDPNVVLSQFATPAAARAAADDYSAAFEAHLAYMRAHPEAPPYDVSPPLHDFAQQHGFAWHPEDAFSWDEMDPLNPNLKIGAAGRVFFAGHAAASDIAEQGLAAFLRARGATDVIAWRHDTTPLLLRIRFTTPAGVSWFNANWEAVLGPWNEGGLTDGVLPAPTDANAVLAFTGPELSAFNVTGTSWCVLAPLLMVASRDDVDVSLLRST